MAQLNRRHYKDWIAAYIRLFDGRTEAPTRLHRWTAIAVIGGAATRRVWIDEVIFRLYPNFYIVFVAPPGVVTKSTAISLGINILRELDHIYLAADNTTYPAFIRDLALRQSEIFDQQGPSLGVDDEIIRQCAVTAAISELGTFFRVEDEDMVNGLTDLFDCRALLVKDTKTAGTDIVEHPFVNLIAGTTPDWIKNKLQAIGGWGLSSRMILLYTSEKALRVARPSKFWKPGEYDRIVKHLIEDLRHISTLTGRFTFSPAADTLAEEWYERNGVEAAAHNKNPDSDKWLGYFLARKQIHAHKLAMIFSLARRDSLVIEEEDLQEAIEHIEEVQLEIPKLFEPGFEPTAAAHTERMVLNRIAHEIKASTEEYMPRASLFRIVSRYVDSSSFNRIVDNAISRGGFRQLVEGRVTKLSLPSEE